MSDFSDAELRRLDLTLLLVLLGLLRHGNAGAVARDLALTPSAVSQALKRLRDIFGDPLFLRRPRGLSPTAVALGLEGPVRTAVEALRGALGAAAAFDAARHVGVLRIAALDAEQVGLLPALAAALRAEAPGLRVAVLPLGRRDAVEALTEGRADLCLGFLWDAPAALARRALFRETYLVAGPPQALPDAPSLSLDAYLAVDHVLVSPAGDLTGIVDRALAAQARSRRVVLALPAFLPALAAAAELGCLVTLPARIARAHAARFGLVTAMPPLSIRPFEVSAFWHLRNERDPRLAWVVGRLAALAA